MTDPLNIETIVSFIKARVPFAPEIAIVCGSGLSGLSRVIQDPISIPYSDIPGFPESTVAGHGTELVFGNLHGRKVVAMRGRFHFYEGYPVSKVPIGVRVFAALGAKVLIVTNAAGGVNPNFNVGDIMIIEDHISFPGMSGCHPLIGHNDARFGPRFAAVTYAYTKELQTIVEEAAAETNLTQYLRRGVYVAVSGPTYETRHEIGAMRMLGGDSVGMSTVPEVIVAAHSGLKVIGLSLITNKCIAPGDDFVAPSHEEVLEATEKRAQDMQALVSRVIAKVDTSLMPTTQAAEHFAKHPSAPVPAAASPKSCSWARAFGCGASQPAAPCACPVSGSTSGSACPFVCIAGVAAVAAAAGAAAAIAVAKYKLFQ